MAEPLTEHDLRGLSAVIEEGRRDRPTEGMPWAVLEGLAALIPCDEVLFPEADLAHGRGLLSQWYRSGDRTMNIGGEELPAEFWEYLRRFARASIPIGPGTGPAPFAGQTSTRQLSCTTPHRSPTTSVLKGGSMDCTCRSRPCPGIIERFRFGGARGRTSRNATGSWCNCSDHIFGRSTSTASDADVPSQAKQAGMGGAAPCPPRSRQCRDRPATVSSRLRLCANTWNMSSTARAYVAAPLRPH